MTDGADLDLIRRRLDTLPMVTRAVFLLHRIDDLGYDEIAWRFGIGTEAVERQMARALYTIAWGRRRWWRRWWRDGERE